MTGKSKRIKVLIVDDSAFIREVFTSVLSSDPEIEVVGSASDPYDAREKIKTLLPDVITLDIEMPRMDGLTFLEKIIALRPMPVVMVSTLTQRGAESTIRALETGAVDYVTKPSLQSLESLSALSDELRSKVKAAATARIHTRSKTPATTLKFQGTHGNRLIAIGASTGGVEAIRAILEVLPANLPPIVITQHMPEGFTASFANRLDQICQVTVHEAHDRQKLQPGHAYIAPGDFHMEIRSQTDGYHTHITRTAPVSSHRPSVDVMFRSVALCAGAHAIGILLTGMGRDGAAGMLEMHKTRAYTIAQNEASCVVYGMPRIAVELGAADKILPLHAIAAEIIDWATHPVSTVKQGAAS